MNTYITVDNLNIINAELSNYCNAACPMCPRFDFNLNLIKEITNNSHTSLETVRNNIGYKILSQLNKFYSCGVVGDSSMNPECLDIFDYVKSSGTRIIELNTNGGARNKEFWKDLAKLKVTVIFSIDGLEDTNHLYRRNVKWDRLMNNVQSFLMAGGKAKWDFLIFKHNEHQIEKAEELSKQLGFVSFQKKYTTRWDDFNSDGKWIKRESITVDNYKLEKVSPQNKLKGLAFTQKSKITDDFMTKKINCFSYHNSISEVYIAADGSVSPCCWLGNLKIHEAKNIIDDYTKININHCSLDEILSGSFFQELSNGIQGKEGARRLQTCYHTCGVN